MTAAISAYLQEVRARLEAATPGPWYNYGACGWLGIVIGTTPEMVRLKTGQYPTDGDPDFSTNVVGVNYEHFEGKDTDCDLIASAPTDLKLLVECLELSMQVIAFYQLRSNMQPFVDVNNTLDAKITRPAVNALAEIEKLIDERVK